MKEVSSVFDADDLRVRIGERPSSALSEFNPHALVVDDVQTKRGLWRRQRHGFLGGLPRRRIPIRLPYE